MRSLRTEEATGRNRLRLWPGVVIVALQWLLQFVVPVVVPEIEAKALGVLGGVVGGLAVFVWWAFFSRAPRSERWGAVLLVIVAMAATPSLLHESVATGNAGFQFYVYSIPVLSLAFVTWAVASRRLGDRLRLPTMAATILLACGVWTLLRSDGLAGDGDAQFAWRWAETSEERLLARDADEPMARPPLPAAAETGAGWPGFRGPKRDGIVRGVRLETDWSRSPPVELWRRPVGPGASSVAVRGGLLYTQEQRGEDEVVACYSATTGEPVWRHHDTARYWDSYVGAGPRATPTVSDGRVFTLGATGILNALDAVDGTVVWSRDAASDTGAELPIWGFVSSPLVVDEVVIVHTDKLAAYDLTTGDPRWFGPAVGGSYSSPHLLTIDGVTQILLLANAGATGAALADGALLWKHPWPGIGIVQPALIADGDLLISMLSSAAMPIGTRRLAVEQGPGGWTVEERWTSTRLRPSFNSLVVHQGHAFGFDGRLLACIDVENGERKWKGGRFGSGQVLLLADQDLLLVVSERGELALVAATGDRFTEVARFPAIEGKTWSQPTLVGDLLLLRNAEEMAAFRLPLASG